MSTGHVSPVMRQKAKGSRPKRNAERRAARRLVLQGFPISPRKFSKEEIDAYLSGDRIQCLVCGKSYKKLGGQHLKIHDLTVEEYRELYGLPWRTGIMCKDSRERYAAAAKRRGALAEQSEEDRKKARAKAHETLRKRGRRTQPFNRETARERLAKINRRDPWPKSSFWTIVERVLTGRTVPEVCRDPDVPGPTWFRDHCRENPADKKRFLEKLDQLTFSTQATIGFGLGPRFWNEVARRREAGESDHTIAAELGVSAMAVNRGRKKRGIS